MIWVFGVLIAVGGGDGSGVVPAPRSYQWLYVGNIVCVHIYMYVSTHTYVHTHLYINTRTLTTALVFHIHL